MTILLLITLASVIPGIYKSEEPLGSCPRNAPFRLVDGNCVNFTEICIRKENSDCKSVLNECSQCPPSGYTISMLATLNNKIDELKNYGKVDLGLSVFHILSFIGIVTIICHVFNIVKRVKEKMSPTSGTTNQPPSKIGRRLYTGGYTSAVSQRETEQPMLPERMPQLPTDYIDLILDALNTQKNDREKIFSKLEEVQKQFFGTEGIQSISSKLDQIISILEAEDYLAGTGGTRTETAKPNDTQNNYTDTEQATSSQTGRNTLVANENERNGGGFVSNNIEWK